MKTFEIWQDNGASQEVQAADMNQALDKFCNEAGYVDHADYCQQMDLEESPFNIKEIN